MDIYLITRQRYSYDDFDAYVIAANTPDEVRELAVHTEYAKGYAWDTPDVNIELVGTFINSDIKAPHVICSSFNAG